jgi:hypothetical protein
MWKRRIARVVIVLICLVTCGCIVSTENISKERGKKLKNSSIRRLEPGVTTKDWAISTLGTPTSRNKVDDSTELLKYEYSKTVNHELAIFLILGSESEKTTSESVCLEFKDDILARYWSEDD